MALLQPLARSTSAGGTDRRWDAWYAAAPLFERSGYAVTMDELARASGRSPAELAVDFPSPAAIALFPLTRAGGVRREWSGILASLPPDRAVRLRNLVELAVEYADDWRHAFSLARQMADDPSVEALAARAVIGARRDFAGIVASVDPAMTRDALLRLIDALSAAALGDVPDVERTRVATRRRLAGAVVGWLAREGMDPAPFLGCLGAAPALWPPGATAIEAGAAAGPMPRL